MELAELIESSGMFYGLTVEILGFYLTVTSGYLIVAYLAGDKLTGSQMMIISTLYVGMASLAAYGATVWVMRGVYFATQQKLVDSAVPIYPGNFIPLTLGLFLGGGVVACLKFMWDVRHSKTE